MFLLIHKALYATCVGLSVVAYATSFFLPTFNVIVRGESHAHLGYEAFYLSLIPLPFDTPLLPMIAWLANVLWVAALVCSLRDSYKPAMILGCIGVLLASIYLWDRNGLLLGYYLWVSSLCLIILGAVFRWIGAAVESTERAWVES